MHEEHDEDYFDPWWREALCAEVGSELFFLQAGEPGTEAKRVCRLCPVRVKCLADAARNDLDHGIFGGFGRDERRKLAARIEAGEDPIAVATEAIANERKPRGSEGADNRRQPAARRDRHRVSPHPAGRP